MIKSMTGYGKAECRLGQDKYIFEIRSVNGRSADISLKTSVIPREHEAEVRQYFARRLSRGSIDLFVTVEKGESSAARVINPAVVRSYVEQLKAVSKENRLQFVEETALPMVMRMPDVFEQQTSDQLTDAQWDEMYAAIKGAVESLDEFRVKEGESLRRDVLGQVDKIEAYVCDVEKYEKERTSAVRERIENRMKELSFEPDQNRMEQEMIFYIEKLDINEEKVRLRQHCKYFRETADSGEPSGRKLGFIAQEMGREINTMGSKANHAEIQKIVVKMKDELEKIKEQTLNIL